jgi:predicted Zn-dependent protease
MHQLLVEQGRTAEAQRYAAMLQSHRTRDPYYWIDLGLRYLQEERPRDAIEALEQARDMTNGFHELHRYLAVAYWKAGQPNRANEELALLAQLTNDEAGVSTLRKKFKSTTRQ